MLWWLRLKQLQVVDITLFRTCSNTLHSDGMRSNTVQQGERFRRSFSISETPQKSALHQGESCFSAFTKSASHPKNMGFTFFLIGCCKAKVTPLTATRAPLNYVHNLPRGEIFLFFNTRRISKSATLLL